MGCLAFWFGNTLYQRLAQEFHTAGVPPTPLVGEVINLSSLVIVVGSVGPSPSEEDHVPGERDGVPPFAAPPSSEPDAVSTPEAAGPTHGMANEFIAVDRLPP